MWVFVHGPKVEDLDLSQHLSEWEEYPVRIIVPMVVVDELDALKESKDRHARWRARYTLAFLDARITDPPRAGILHKHEEWMRVGAAGGLHGVGGSVYIEFLSAAGNSPATSASASPNELPGRAVPHRPGRRG
ncbi:hypothetical protein GCM10023194_40240 [Planotetraspora phitsanulokensis]|uniref:PIN domain-containing protein n=1 Tax=Planotetraspora phitsanulokensis TaxID=575192 RepID=A0A8J3U928_9ACTN|nr:hypothetical protein Pph01_59920 [Planotetraspora phitsanulokensis]